MGAALFMRAFPCAEATWLFHQPSAGRKSFPHKIFWCHRRCGPPVKRPRVGQPFCTGSSEMRRTGQPPTNLAARGVTRKLRKREMGVSGYLSGIRNRVEVAAKDSGTSRLSPVYSTLGADMVILSAYKSLDLTV
jgi:hypothetical protein